MYFKSLLIFKDICIFPDVCTRANKKTYIRQVCADSGCHLEDLSTW